MLWNCQCRLGPAPLGFWVCPAQMALGPPPSSTTRTHTLLSGFASGDPDLRRRRRWVPAARRSRNLRPSAAGPPASHTHACGSGFCERNRALAASLQAAVIISRICYYSSCPVSFGYRHAPAPPGPAPGHIPSPWCGSQTHFPIKITAMANSGSAGAAGQACAQNSRLNPYVAQLEFVRCSSEVFFLFGGEENASSPGVAAALQNPG